MKDPREPNTFSCMDDDPRNNGNGYNHQNPYDDYPEEIEDIEVDDEIENDDLFD